MEVKGASPRHHGLQDLMSPLRVGSSGHQTHTQRDAVDVRVDGERVVAASEEQHARTGLGADARQAGKPLARRRQGQSAKSAERETTLSLADRLQDRLDPPALQTREAAVSDRSLDGGGWRFERTLPGGKRAFQRCEGSAAVDVARGLGKDSGDELVECFDAAPRRPAVSRGESIGDDAQPPRRGGAGGGRLAPRGDDRWPGEARPWRGAFRRRPSSGSLHV